MGREAQRELKAKNPRGPWLWPLALAAVGVVLLFDNFLLLQNFNVVALWPLLLVVIGAAILLRGDIVPSVDARTFSITRGSVEAATVEISAGVIDVQAQGLEREGRLIAGQYAANAKPDLSVSQNYAVLRMDRAETSWLSFADWILGLAVDLPWRIYVSTSLGQVDLDLSHVIIEGAVIATGVGDIRFVCPREAFGPSYLRSTLGNIHVVIPPGYNTRIVATGSPMFKIHADDRTFDQPAPGVYVNRDADDHAPLVEVHVSGTFGDAYLVLAHN
ncbi:MAG: hypothetical protein H7175_04870 [Burkholderiales bacterium]|nr:hypothetical protein [Anaerolineae bacterium]